MKVYNFKNRKISYIIKLNIREVSIIFLVVGMDTSLNTKTRNPDQIWDKKKKTK